MHTFDTYWIGCALSIVSTDLLLTQLFSPILHSNPGNPGRSYDDNVDLTEALKDHYNPELAKKKLREVHEWLKSDTSLSEDEKNNLGWQQAYNLTTWGKLQNMFISYELQCQCILSISNLHFFTYNNIEEFPGEVISVSNVLLSRMGIKSGGGNQKDAVAEANDLRGAVRRRSSLVNVLKG